MLLYGCLNTFSTGYWIVFKTSKGIMLIKTKFKCIIALKSGYTNELRPKFIDIIALKVVIFLN